MLEEWICFLLGDLFGLGRSGMKGAKETDSCFKGDLTYSLFLGEFSFDCFLLNSLVGEKFFRVDKIDCPKVSGLSAEDWFLYSSKPKVGVLEGL